MKRWHGGALALYSILTLLLTWPLALNLTRAIPGDGFDGWQNYWNLWWMKVALVERVQSPLVTDLLYYPTGVSLYFHTLNPFNGLLALPVQLSGSILLAYNFIVFVSFVLSGYGAFLLALWVLNALAQWRGEAETRRTATASYGAALIAGVIFAFAPFHFAHLLGHMQVFAYQWIPFSALYLLRALDTATDVPTHRSTDALTHQITKPPKHWLRESLLAALFITFAALCDWYFALYLAFFGGLAVIWFWAMRGKTAGWARALWRSLLAVGVAGVVSVVLLLPLLLPMVREAVQYDFMVRPASDLYILSASALDFVLPSRMNPLVAGDLLNQLGNQIAPISERTLAIGWVALLLILAGLWRNWRRSLPWVVGAIIFALLAMGPALHWLGFGWEQIPEAGQGGGEWSLYALLNQFVPFMRISRSVSRFALMVQMCVAVGAAFGAQAILLRASRRAVVVWSGVLVALLLVEYWSAPFPMSEPDTPAFYESIAAVAANAPRVDSTPDYAGALDALPNAPGAMLNLPMNYDRPGYLLYQTEHRMPLAVAYISRDDPRTLTERVPVLQNLRVLGDDIIKADLAAVGKTVLSDLGISIVTLDRYKMPGGDEREATEEIAAQVFGDDTPIYEDERLTAYAVTAPETPAPYLALGEVNWGPRHYGANERVIRRELGEGNARVIALHAPQNAAVEIHYLSATPLQVFAKDGTLRSTYPEAPVGNLTWIELPVDGEFSLYAPGAQVFRLELVDSPYE